jgi:hypothetical protein
MRHRIAIVVAVSVAITVAVSGCAASPSANDEFTRLDSEVSSWDGVDSVAVDGAYDGLPTSRSLSIDVTLTDASETDLTDYLDRTLKLAWTFDAYKPSSIFVSFVDDKVEVPDGQIPRTIDLTDEVASLGFTDVTTGKNFLSVPNDAMAEHYGPWPADPSESN